MASAWSQLDQLLTCAICLDRYRNPKLLPCQHTFCMEPCLDGLIDYGRRQIKCPECRAEHRIPYQGIQQYPTNVTLMRFLELHRDITGEEPEPPPSMMERCSVCSEKSNVERCAHCDKKICPDCKEAHVDILRREINRINNQVRRGLHRLSEALAQTKKNAEKLQFNCEQVKEEIEDIVRRYSKDLRVTEEKLKHDLEIYTQQEVKSITKLKEDLEIEVSNITSNCDLVDKYIKDDFEWSDVELLEYKQVFLKMLDFLRTFDPDSTDFSRRIKFQPRADPDVLHRNIVDFGELKINAPPAPQNIGLMRSQSDHRLAAQFARRSFPDNQRLESERPTSPLARRSEGYRRYNERTTTRERDTYETPSSRYWAREEVGSRWRDEESEPHSRTVRFADEQNRLFDVDDATKGPLSGVVRLLDSPRVMERLHQNEVKHKQQQQQPTQPEKANEVPPRSEPPPQRSEPPPRSEAPQRRPPARQQSEDDIDRQKRANQQQQQQQQVATEPASEPETADRSRRSQDERNRLSRPSLVKATSLDGGEPSSRKPLDKKMPPRAATPVALRSHDDDDDEDEYETAEEPPKPIQSPFFSRQRRLPEPEPRLLEMHEDDSESEESEEDDDEEEEEDTAQVTPKPETRNEEESSEEESSEEDDDEEESSSESEPEATPAQVPQSTVPSTNGQLPAERPSTESEEEESEEEEESSKSSEEEEDEEVHAKPTEPRRRASPAACEVNGYRSRKRSDDTDTTDSSSASSSTNYHSSLSRNNTPLVSPVANEEDNNSNDAKTSRFRRRPYLARSKSSHEIGLGYDANLGLDDDDDDEESPAPAPTYRSRSERASEDNTRTRSGLTDSTPSSQTSNSCWAKYLKSKYGSNATGRVVPRSRSSHSLYQRSDSESSEEETTPSGRDPVSSSTYGFSNPRSTYMQKRRMMFKIGSRGTEAGNFTWPRGVAVGPDNSIVVADSSNHRIQVFDAIGKFLFEFGTYGSGEGDFDCLAGVSVNRIGQIIVSDRYNHRVQLFDQTGRFLRAFGCEGRTDGRFNYPWGIATDSLGFIYVCDKENHRIQVFQSDGTFVGKFGGIGSRPGQLEHPHYVAVTNTNRVVVTDTNNHRVQIFDVNGRSLSTFGSEGSQDGQFKFPRGVAVDDQGYIIIGDSGNNRIQIFQPDGTFLKSFGTWGAGDGEFKGLEGLAVTTGGSIIACDRENHRIQVF